MNAINNSTFCPKYSFFVLRNNILGIKWIEKTVAKSFWLLNYVPSVLVWCFVSTLRGNSQSGSRDRKYLIGCYWKNHDNRNFYQISCITITVIFFRRTCWNRSSWCSEKMQHIYRRTTMPKSDFNKVAMYIILHY